MRWVVAWSVFVAVHAVLIVENLVAPNGPLGDVQFVYPYWWSNGIAGAGWVGLTTSGVYPFLSLIPIIVAGNGLVAWFVLIVLLDAIAFAVVARQRPVAGYTWLGFQLALGPIALGRIDAVTVALSLIAVALIERAPRIAGTAIAIATWVKVWPVVLGVAAMHTARFGRVALWAVGIALTILGAGILVGDTRSVLSFLSEQGERGIQVESVIATPWWWDAWGGGSSRIDYSPSLLTFEVSGPASSIVASWWGIAQGAALVVVALVVFLTARLGRSRATSPSQFASALLVLVTILIVINKVGSPQFVSWLAVPLVALMADRPRKFFGVSVALIVLIAALTHVLYPYVYFAFLALETGPLVVATLRNSAEVALLVVAIIAWIGGLRLKKFGEQKSDVLAVNQESVVPVRR